MDDARDILRKFLKIRIVIFADFITKLILLIGKGRKQQGIDKVFYPAVRITGGRILRQILEKSQSSDAFLSCQIIIQKKFCKLHDSCP